MGLPLMPAASPPAAAIAGPEARKSTRAPAGPASARTPRVVTRNSETVVPRKTVLPIPVMPGTICATGRTWGAAPSGAASSGNTTSRAASTAPYHRPARPALRITASVAPASNAAPRLLDHHGDLEPAQHHPLRPEGRGGGGRERGVGVCADRLDHRRGQQVHQDVGVHPKVLEVV